MPNISIIIPLYNKVRYIQSTLDSVFSQTYRDFEIIVVDDGSSDGSGDLVERINDERIRLIRQKNQGVSVARNLGAENARGKYLVFLDADDSLAPHYLKLMVQCVESQKVKWALCRQNVISNNGVLAAEAWDGALPARNACYFDLFLKGRAGCPACHILERESFGNVGGFVPGIKNGEDIEYFWRVALNYPEICYCDLPMVNYSQGVVNSATSIARSEESLILLWETIGNLCRMDASDEVKKQFFKCVDSFANNSLRFYIREGYVDAADSLFGLDCYAPSFVNSFYYYLPGVISRPLLKLLLRVKNVFKS